MKNIENVACKTVIAYTIIDSIAMTASIIMAHNARKALQAKKPEKRQDDQLDGIRDTIKAAWLIKCPTCGKEVRRTTKPDVIRAAQAEGFSER